MAYVFDDRLIEVKTQLARKKHLENKLKDLLLQKEEAQGNARVLMFEKDKEQKEADKYEDSFLYRLQSIIGMGEGKLEKEKEEALDALLRYEAALSEFNAVCEEVVKVQDEYLSIKETEDEYSRMLDIKRKYVVTYGDETSKRILDAENALTDIETSRLPEINEAIESGRKAQELSRKLADELFDIKFSSSLEVAVVLLGGRRNSVRSRSNDTVTVDKLVKELRSSLASFKAELSDVKINDESGDFAGFEEQYRIFKEIFFASKASKAQTEVEELYTKITNILTALDKEKNDLTAEIERLNEAIEQMIITSKLKRE